MNRLISKHFQAVVSKNSVQTDPLFNLDGEEFVRHAYWIVFQRGPDSCGLDRYTSLLNKGVSKQEVLSILTKSHEARTKSVNKELPLKEKIDVKIFLLKSRFIKFMSKKILGCIVNQ